MKTMKKPLSLLLAFVLFVTMIPMNALAAEAEEVVPCEHVYTTVVTAPTCTTNGYTTYTCVNCGDSYDTNVIFAAGHNYTCEKANGYAVYTCKCGDTYSVKLANPSFVKASKLTSNESYVITVYYNRKFYALTHSGTRISARTVTVSNGKVATKVTDNMLWDYNDGTLSYTESGKTYRLYSGPSVSWAGSGTGSATLTGSTTYGSNIYFDGSCLEVGSYGLRFMNGTIKGSVNPGVTYVFQATYK